MKNEEENINKVAYFGILFCSDITFLHFESLDDLQ